MPRSNTNRPLVEQCEAISVSQIQGLPSSGTRWVEKTATLTTPCPTCGTTSPIDLVVVKTRQGPRFLCPKCRRNVAKLYRPPTEPWSEWACLHCHGLVYSSQYRKKATLPHLGFSLLEPEQ